MPQETDQTREEYVKALINSDLTLNPVGINTECYRIYEAMSLGSIPVIEDVMTSGNCGAKNERTSLRLLKKYGAPVVYVKNWSELQKVLMKERELSQVEKVRRRTDILHWYKKFKAKMQEVFLHAIQTQFFADDR